MATWLIDWSLRHRPHVLVCAALLMLAGVWAGRRLNFDAFPDTTPVQVQINTSISSLVPEEIERQVTIPIEQAIAGLPGLEQVRSISQFGLSQVVATFSDRTGIYFARQLIAERLQTVELPPGIERPKMGPVSTGLGEVFHYLLVPRENDAAGKALTDVRTYQDWVLKPALRPTRGTAEINSWGGLEKQYQIRIDPNRLIRHELSFEKVVDAVMNNNLSVGGGNIERDRSGEMLLLHGMGRTIDVNQIGNIVITAQEGVPIRVSNVADVVIGHELRRGMVTAAGRGEVVLGLGFMLLGENSDAVTRRLRAKVEEYRHRLPANLDLLVVYDRSELVEQVIDTVRLNLLDGATLVVLVLLLFLGNLRAGAIVAAAIPLALLFAFPNMLGLGIAGSLLSLGAIDFGIVVDSSVIMIENIARHLAAHPDDARQPACRLQLIRRAAIEVRQPAVFGQLIIIIVYLPILTLEGIEGKMFRPMACTVIFLLVGSLLISLTVIPVLASFFLPRVMSHREPWLVRLAQSVYRPVLAGVLRARWSVAAAAALLLAMVGWRASRMGTEFVPRLSEGAIVVGVMRPAGTDLNESRRLNTLTERLLLAEFPDEIRYVWSRAGGPEVATDPGGVESTDVFVTLTPRDQWRRARSQAELVEQMAAVIGDLPGQTTWFTQPIEQRLNEMVSGVRSDIALKLFGDDLETLVERAALLEQLLRMVPGSADVAVEQVFGQPVLQVKIDQDAIARYGVPASTVLELVEAVGGKPVGQIVEGTLRFPLAIRLPDAYRQRPETIDRMLVPTALGERIPLSRLADCSVQAGPRVISHQWGQRCITVQCNVRGRDVGSFVAEAQDLLDEQFELPAGNYRLEWGGQFENMRQATERLSVVVPLALALIVLLLYLTYRNVVDTLLVATSVPMACVGGILALQWRDLPLSLPAAVGFITLAGVSVLNNMVFSTQVRHLQSHGVELGQAIRQTGLTRLRAVMMTAIVACAGFLPMALSQGVGAEVQRPLATVVIGGVFSSTLMELLLMPVLYSFFGRWRYHPPAVASH